MVNEEIIIMVAFNILSFLILFSSSPLLSSPLLSSLKAANVNCVSIYKLKHFLSILICSVHGKVKPKPLSFQEFDNKTSDAWGEDDDDAIRVDPEEKKNSRTESRVRTISGGDVRASIPSNVKSTEPRKLPEQLTKKEEHKTSRPSPLSLLSKCM